jgi:aspartate aminotransferase-like enzyme
MPATQRDHVKLCIPGPVEISPETYAAMAQPMIGHRSKDFQQLYAACQPGLQELFGTSQPVFLSTSSAWGVMEGAVRNLVRSKVLNCCSGAFSDKWYDVSLRCDKAAEALQFEWGQPLDPAAIEARLATGQFDAVTLIHNETSTGVLNPLAEIAALKRRFPDVMFIVDTVSSFSTIPIDFDQLGIDLMLTGSQKALALPPGLALFAASQAAFDRASSLSGRGYYFDLLEFLKNHESHMTPSTPCISLIYGLRYRLAQIAEESLPARFARHADLNAMVHAWVTARGFAFFAPDGFRSPSLTCIANNRDIDVSALQADLRQRHQLALDGGYGKIKGKTFRISNMGDESQASIQELLDALDDCLPT